MKHFIIAIVVLLMTLFATLVYELKWDKIREKSINVKIFSYLHDAPVKELILNDTNGTDEISLQFSFRVDEFKNYENIFQTASVNDGFRMEINNTGALALVFSTDKGLDAIQVDQNVKKGVWNDVIIHYDREKVLKVYYNKQSIFNGIRPDIKVKINEIVIGQGFSEERPFLGDLKNFNIQYSIFNIRPHSDFYIGLIQLLLIVSIVLLLIKTFMISSYGKIIIERIFVNYTAFLVFIGAGVVALVALNSFYCIIMGAVGYTEYPYTNFLFPSEDRFADLIKIAISFTTPLAGVIDYNKIAQWPEIFQGYFFHNPYGGIDAIQKGELSHILGAPFGHLYEVLNGYIAFVVSPTFLYALYALLYILSISMMVHLLKKKYKISMAWMLAGVFIFSYPGLYIFIRGHFFSGFAVMILSLGIISLILGKQRMSWIAFGIAMNMRPNFVLFAPLIYSAIKTPREFFVYCFKLGVWSIILLSLFYWAMYTLYPGYTFTHTLEATRIYDTSYNYGNAGLAFGSSLYGSLYGAAKLYGINPQLMTPIGHTTAVMSFLMLSVGILLRRFSAVEATFLLSCFYALFTPVLGDYQLLIFALPLVVYLLAKNYFCVDTKEHVFVIGVATILLISPKNYVYIEDLKIYSQVFINPSIMAIASFYVWWNRMRRGKIQYYDLLMVYIGKNWINYLTRKSSVV